MPKRPPRSKRSIAAVVALAGVVTGAAFLAGWMFSGRDASVAADEVSWLYSQTADGAELDDLGEGRYRLVLRDVDAYTIKFSDRPHRLVQIIDTARLVHDWDHLFADSAPNAVLVEHELSGETDSLVVVLERPVYDAAARTLTYDALLLADERHPERLVPLGAGSRRPPVHMRYVSLFIDSVHDVGGQSVDPASITGNGAQRLLDLLAGADLGGGAHLVAASVEPGEDGSVSGTATVSFATTGFAIQAQFTLTDAQNWSITAVPSDATPWTAANLPSLSIDPSSFSGTVSMTGGVVDYELVGATHTWHLANGATYVSTPEFTLACPLAEAQCPSGVDGPFLAMSGSLTVAGLPGPIALDGAMTTDGDWARFDGNAGDIELGGFTVTNASATIWHGQRTDSYDPNMDLPSLATLNSGFDFEFCGGFILPIPGHSNAATDGCARWSPAGVVIGQVGVGISVDGTLPSTGAAAPVAAQVTGASWTNLAADVIGQLPTPDVVMSGVHAALESQAIVLAGQASLPGVAADALDIDLGGAESLVFDVTGKVSSSGFDLAATIATDIRLGAEPFRTDITAVTATISAERGSGASFSIGTTGTAFVGYGSDSRQIATTVQLVAATPPNAGMSLSINARGTPAASDAGRDGLTASTRLQEPAGAVYVWPDQFGIDGMNLWNLSVEVAFADGLPSLAYSSTSYLDPNGATTSAVIACDGPCDETDWMVGTLGFDLGVTTPCFAYQFDSTSGNSGFSIDGGTIEVTSFAVGIAPMGCSIQSGSTLQSLPAGFAGFSFSAQFGSTTLDVATQVSPAGFVFQESITNLQLAGITYETVALSITIDDTGSDVAFTAVMDSGMGDMAVDSEFSASESGVSQSLDANLTDWSWAGGNIDIEEFSFSTSSTIPTTATGCASFSAAAEGTIVLAGSTIELDAADIAIDCTGVNTLELDLTYSHTAHGGAVLTEHLELKYPTVIAGRTYLYGETDFGYQRHFSKRYSGRTFSRDVAISIWMSVSVDPATPANSGFGFGGSFKADRASGSVTCELPPDSADFDCSGRLRVNPRWAGVYRVTWDGL